MALFDAYIQKLADYQQELRVKGRQVREIDCPNDISELLEGLPVRVGPQASSGIILRGDTAAELGNPDSGSAALLLWTDNPSLIRDGKITLVGSDISESEGSSLPFGQVLMVGGEGLSEKEHERLESSQYVADKIEGYMIKSTPRHMWCRVSKEALGKGFRFETLGRALMAIFKSEVPKVQSVEAMFVTSGKDDLEPLDSIGEQIQQISQNITKDAWKAKGYDLDEIECTLGWDCRSCDYRPVCDDIRKVVKVRKKKTTKGKSAIKDGTSG
jgi:CO dehydrogenase/acetyl-CoA synthase beta subunit